MSRKIVKLSTRLLLLSATTMSLSACATLDGALNPTPVPPTIVVENECPWAKKITLSEESLTFFSQNITNPQVRLDIDQIVAHNESYEKFCGA